MALARRTQARARTAPSPRRRPECSSWSDRSSTPRIQLLGYTCLCIGPRSKSPDRHPRRSRSARRPTRTGARAGPHPRRSLHSLAPRMHSRLRRRRPVSYRPRSPTLRTTQVDSFASSSSTRSGRIARLSARRRGGRRDRRASAGSAASPHALQLTRATSIAWWACIT
jgi:hypothetical protein